MRDLDTPALTHASVNERGSIYKENWQKFDNFMKNLRPDHFPCIPQQEMEVRLATGLTSIAHGMVVSNVGQTVGERLIDTRIIEGKIYDYGNWVQPEVTTPGTETNVDKVRVPVTEKAQAILHENQAHAMATSFENAVLDNMYRLGNPCPEIYQNFLYVMQHTQDSNSKIHISPINERRSEKWDTLTGEELVKDDLGRVDDGWLLKCNEDERGFVCVYSTALIFSQLKIAYSPHMAYDGDENGMDPIEVLSMLSGIIEHMIQRISASKPVA